MDLRLSPNWEADLRCSICHDQLNPRTRARCAECGTLFHRSCAYDLGECPSLGCIPTDRPGGPPPPSPALSQLKFVCECVGTVGLSIVVWLVAIPAVFAAAAYLIAGGYR